jgi:hypothetical protein
MAVVAAAILSLLASFRGVRGHGVASGDAVSVAERLDRFAFGSCSKQARPNQTIWEAVARSEPQLWLWSGESL